MPVKGSSVPTRMNAEVAAAAAIVGRSEHRTATEQMNHWARIGMQVERATTAAGRRMLAVVSGEAQFSSLTPQERVAAHGVIDARMAERAASEQFGPAVRKAGQVTVSIDDDGVLVEISPDGSRRPL